MSPKAIPQGFNRTTVEVLSRFKEEPFWMTELRLAAWEGYAKDPLPSSSLGFSLEAMRSYSEPPTTPIPSREWPEDLQHALEERGDEEGLIVQRDSTILSKAITKEQSKKGVIFTDLDTALQTVPDLVQKYFTRPIKLEQPAAALNAAFWSGGTFLYVPEYLDIELPFHTCYWMSLPGAAMFPHTLIVVEKGSRISFTDEYLSASWPDPGLSLAVVEAWVGENANLNYFNIQNWGQSIHHHLTPAMEIATEGRLMSYYVDMGGRTPKNRIDVTRIETGRLTSQGGARFEDLTACEELFNQISVTSIAEKLRHYVTGWLTGHRPSMTLERVAQLHPEVRR